VVPSVTAFPLHPLNVCVWCGGWDRRGHDDSRECVCVCVRERVCLCVCTCMYLCAYSIHDVCKNLPKRPDAGVCVCLRQVAKETTHKHTHVSSCMCMFVAGC